MSSSTNDGSASVLPVVVNAAPGYGPPPRLAAQRAAVRRNLHLVLPVLIYLALVLGSVTTSSIGTPELRADPAAPLGTQVGNAAAIRSDEYLTESAIWLGQLAVGTGDLPNTVGVSPDFFAQLPSGPVSGVVFLDGTLLMLGQWLPQSMLFAAKWWLPTLLLLLGLPVWFRQITGSMRWGYLASALILFSPSTAWWSGRPVNTLGFIAAGCALGIWGIMRLEMGRRAAGVSALVVAGIVLARYPTYYQPLAIMVGLPVVLATLTYLLARPVPWQRKLIGVGALTLSGLVWTGALMWENRAAIIAGLDTVYPGERVSTSESLPIGRVFGAPNLGWLESQEGSIAYGQNATELAQSFTVLLIVAFIMLGSRAWRGGRVLAWTVLPVLALGGFWLLWGTVYLGDIGSALPLVNRVPGFRASHGAGFVAIIAFCLVLSQWRSARSWRAPLLAGGLAGFLTAWAGSSLQITFLPALQGKMIWASATITGLLVLALLRWPGRWQPMVATGLAGLVLVFSANPILIGLADLRGSATAEKFLAEGAAARADGEVWASDSRAVDALFFATGTPSISTRQQVGPDVDFWERLDPGLAHEDYWNRGGTFVSFVWTSDGDDQLAFELPNPDIVQIYGSPCTVAERVPELTSIASSMPLTNDCLTPAGEFQWSGVTHFVYDVTQP